MNTFTTNCLDFLASLTEEKFHNEEFRQQFVNDHARMLDILSTAKELILTNPMKVLSVEYAAFILEEDPDAIRGLIEDNQELFTLDGWKEPYLTVRAFFRLTGLLPDNPLAQECISQLLNIALK